MNKDPYETPRTPPATPPVIDPNVDPKTAAQFATDGESEGDVIGQRSNPGKIDTGLNEELMRRDARDGAGEAELDRMPPD